MSALGRGKSAQFVMCCSKLCEVGTQHDTEYLEGRSGYTDAVFVYDNALFEEKTFLGSNFNTDQVREEQGWLFA